MRQRFKIPKSVGDKMISATTIRGNNLVDLFLFYLFTINNTWCIHKNIKARNASLMSHLRETF